MTYVLIAGGGIGGLCCAVELKEQNPDLDVIVVEKQFAGYGGKANKGGGVLQYFNDDLNPNEFVGFHSNVIGCFLGNQEMMLQYVTRNHELINKLDGWGVSIPRKEDGTYLIMPTGPFTHIMCVDLDLCLKIRKRAESLGVRFYDKTTVAELFKNENDEIIGAAAYSIIDGEVFTIQAKRVVMATGSQNYRVAPMWSSGRGDGIAAAYRVGAEMRNTEFGNFAQLMKANSHLEVVFGENYMRNAKNENITKNFRSRRETDINSNAIAEWYKQMNEGNGPVHLDFSENPDEETSLEKTWPRKYGKRFNELNHDNAAAVDNGSYEVCPLLIGEQSPIRVENDMQTTIRGLYAIGDCSYGGSATPGAVPAPPGRNRGSGILNAVFAAVVCAENLVKEPDKELTALDEKEIDKCVEEIFAPLNRTSGHTAKEVIAKIQAAMGPMENSVLLCEERMAECEKMVDEAAEMAKDLCAEDMHGVLSCHEAEAMVLSAKMHFTAARMRKESRGWFYRTDFPETDNENWLKWIIVKNENGEMTTRTEDVPLHLYGNRPEGYVKKVKVPVTEEEMKDELFAYYNRPMTAPDPSRYEEVKIPVNPEEALLAEDLNELFKEGYLPVEKGYCQLPNGAATLANLTQMPGVTPEMFDWWFAWHGVKPLRYKIWDPDDHWSAQTRNLDKALDESLSMKERYWDTFHDVHEDTGLGPENILIHFRNPKDIGFDEEELAKFDGTIVCAGDDVGPCIMVHFLRPVEGGCELRTRFWFGYHVIDGKPVCILPEGAKFPVIVVKELLNHNIKEFTNLAAILPELYEKYHDKF